MELDNPKGMRDIPPEEKIVRDRIVAVIRQVYERCGYAPLETPALEKWEVLSAKYAGGDAILDETFKLKDRGSRQLALRYDLTVPLARFIAMNPQLKLPFKRYQIEKVWRDGPMGSGRYREFVQCDADIIGSASMLADAEGMAMLQEVFTQLGLKAVINVNNRKVLNGILEALGITERRDEVILTLDKLDKQPKEEVFRELKEKGIAGTLCQKMLEVLRQEKDNEATLAKLAKIVKSDEGKEGLKQLQELLDYCRTMGVTITINPSLARGLAFYTATVYEVFLQDSSIKSAVSGGGRFDEIIGKFIGKGSYPSFGISLGIDRIYDALKEKNVTVVKTPTLVYVIPILETQEALKACQQLRKAGINTDMDLAGRGVSKNLDYANSQGIPYVLIIGPEEVKKKIVKLRDMKTGKEESITIPKAVARLNDAFNVRKKI